MKEATLTQRALHLISEKGQSAVKQASQIILAEKYGNGEVASALQYYAKKIFPNVLPIFPFLVHISSGAAGKEPTNLNAVAASMMLITASGDIHDDIVDNSENKFGKLTLVGKYGRDIALLAGDVLLTQGLTELQTNCQTLPRSRRSEISKAVATTMFEIIKAEASENALRHKKNVAPDELLEVIRLKGGVAELHCRIGGLVGGAKPKTVETLGQIGRAIGVLSTLKEEFVDLSNPTELVHRLKHELPPYPMLCTMQNSNLKKQIRAITQKTEISFEDAQAVVWLVLNSVEIKNLETEFQGYGEKALATSKMLGTGGGELSILLEALSFELRLV